MLAAGLALLAGAACASAPVPTVRSTSTARAFSERDVDMIASLLEAADTRRPDTTLIDSALGSSTSFVRAFAARTAGQIGLRARAGTLRSLVSSSDSALAADAAFSLGLLKDSAATTILARALAGDPTVAAAAAWSLGELGDPGRAVLEAVLTSGQPRGALAHALQASAKLRPVPATLIARYAIDPSVDVRRAAVYALTRARVPDAALTLVTLDERLAAMRDSFERGSPDAEVDLRSYIARGLARPAVPDSLATRALAALRRLVDDAHPHVRINAIRSLAMYGPVAKPELIRHLRDPDANGRVIVAQSLGGVFGATADEWNAAWSADTGFTFRRALIASAMRSGVRLSALDPGSSSAWQASRDWRYRAAAAEAAGAGSAADIDVIAVPLFRDRDPRVRGAAYAAAVAWADSSPAALKPYGRVALRSALSDTDLFVRATILGALRPNARAQDAAVALGAWRNARHDAENDARLAALAVIAAAWTSDSGSFGALADSLTRLEAPTDPLERSAGRRVGPLRRWPADGVTPRPRAWYTEQVRSLITADFAGRPARATIETSRGSVSVMLLAADAPLTVANFIALANRGYYNGLAFHRVVPNFVAQDGDPRGDGSGGPGYAIRDELNRRWYDRGAVGMALSGPDTGGSQYFLAHSPQPHLDGHYTVFGHVTAGFSVLDAIVQGDRIVRISIQ